MKRGRQENSNDTALAARSGFSSNQSDLAACARAMRAATAFNSRLNEGQRAEVPAGSRGACVEKAGYVVTDAGLFVFSVPVGAGVCLLTQHC